MVDRQPSVFLQSSTPVQVTLKTTLVIVVGLVQAVMTVSLGIWYFAGWGKSVDLRLDDIDKDLKSIHERLDRDEQQRLFGLYGQHLGVAEWHKVPPAPLDVDTSAP